MTNLPTALLIGASSFIGHALGNLPGIKSCSHDTASLQQLIDSHDIIINCAFHPGLRDQPYEVSLDLDTRIATSIQGTHKKLIILSSRTVYGITPDKMHEDMPLRPVTTYATNKATIEDSCRNLLGNNLLVLRMSNAFGFEWPAKPGRISFMSQVLSSLKTKQEMIFDIAPQSEKDFLPVQEMAHTIHHLVKQGATGTYNVGAGISLAMSDVTDAIIKGFGDGRVTFQPDRIDSFYMDVSKLRATGVKLPDASEILKEFEDIGHKLATTEGIQT